jgi:hypothetical protein
VYIFKPAAISGQYEFAGKLGGPPPGGVFGRISAMTVDGGNGDIYVAEGKGNEKAVDEFNSEGVYVGRLTGTPTGPAGEARPFLEVASVAVDPESHHVYVADYRGEVTEIDAFGQNIVFPDVTTGSVTGVKATGEGRIEATLNGTVNPRKEGEASCRFVWGTTKEFGQIAPCEPEKIAEGSSPVAVHAKLSVQPDTTYYYRLQATNKNGANPGEPWQDGEFTTPGPGLRGASTSAVRAESATFNAEIDPHGKPTTYYFQYGTSTTYGADAPTLSEEATRGAAAGSGEGDVEVFQHVTGLVAATLYHYRVVAVSELAPGEFEPFYGSDQTFTTQTVGLPFQLPDGRAWEMVSPPHKEGALLNSIIGGSFNGNPLQASADGSALSDGTSAPTEAEPAGSGNSPTDFFGRGASGWSAKDITTPHIGRTEITLGREEYRYFSEDLLKGAVQPEGSYLPLSPEASEATAYLRTDYMNGNPGELCATGCYQPLVTPANVPSGTKFGEEGSNPECHAGSCGGPVFEGASPDLKHIVLESSVDLTSTSTEGHEGMYEWNDGELALINLLPAGETNQHGGLVAENVALGSVGLNAESIAHVVSNDGSHIVWSTGGGGTGHLYVRDMVKGETVRLDVFQNVETSPEQPPEYRGASSDGSRIFFLDATRLTADSTAKPFRKDLYEYDLNAPAGSRLTDLSVDMSAPAAVRSVLGISEDGSYVYFSAAGVLAPGAVPGECGIYTSAPPGDTQLCNLYLRHNGTTTFIAGLSPEDFPVWSEKLTRLPARVSPNGQWLAFMSNKNLTGYDTTDAVNKHADEEVYLYDAGTGKLVCAGCNPTGARPVGAKFTDDQITGLSTFPSGEGAVTIASNVPVWTDPFYQSRYLSNSGRLFFNSSDALVPQDVNGTQDVYQYEPAGIGDCDASKTTFSERSGGCVALLSSGASKDESAFIDASESGNNVFFLTTAKLLSQDFDDARDIYDARECSATSPCIAPAPVEPPPCETGDSCKSAPSPQPTIFGSPASATFSGAGNVVPSERPAAKQKGLSRTQKLARALKACHKKKNKKKRAVCERQARSRYAAKGSRTANATKRGRG